MNTTNTATRVVVIGGGYAGVLAANRLAGNPGVAVTLVNPRPHFVERIRLHQLTVGTDDAIEAFDRVLAENVERVVDTASRIDAAAARVELASGTAVEYDYLVYAVGSTAATPGLPGSEFAYPVAEFEEAERLAARLREIRVDAPVTVIGAGLTGIEMATELAEAGRAVTLAGAVFAPSVGQSGRRSIRKAMTRLNVAVVEGVSVAALAESSVILSDGRSLPSALTIWTAGFAVPGLAESSGLNTDAQGRLRTDDTLTSIDDPRIVATGDAAAPAGIALRMSCQAAMPLGAQAAQAVLARIAGREPEPIAMSFAAQCISLGRRRGTLQFVRADDSPRRSYLGGRLGAVAKEQVCRLTVSALRREARKPGSYTWPGRKRRLTPGEPAAAA